MPPSKKTISVNGRDYSLSQFVSEAVDLADMLASNAHLKADSPLPADTDLSESDQKEVQAQLPAMLILPPEAMSIIWSAFAANHLTDVAAALRRLSHATQKQALSTAIQILSLFPDPKQEPYFRKFLCNAEAAKDIPTIIARAFVQGTTWKRPAGPGNHCTLIIHMLFWCDPALGDDGKASVDADIRARLAAALDSMLGPEHGAEDTPPHRQPHLVEMERLRGVLNTIENMPGPGAYFIDSTRHYLEGQVDMCGGNMCGEEAQLACSKCKTVRYCGPECQSWHWKNGHKAHCFKTDY
ncbi:hypothetical protein K438DRAFT_1931818 [Mycena galopus ATCC 62051]|nr:hypothetical protein K438DRAFT_1931818 [Mycena galopus ATCC 62051]